jgi:hypothetical protein
MRVHHYMVEYEDEAGGIHFANDAEMTSLTAAKALASRQSKKFSDGAYVVAFHEDADGRYSAIGHISFFDGKQSETDGIVI